MAQDTEAKGTKLKVRSSPPVLQTLNLLGAKSWIDIETCPKPNPKPQATATPAPTPAPESAPAEKSAPGTYLTPAKGTVDLSSSSPTPLGTKRTTLGGLHASLGQSHLDASLEAASHRAGGPLVEDDADIPE